MQEKDFTYRSPPYRATQAANSLWGEYSISSEKIVCPWFMSRLPVVSEIMAHFQIQIVSDVNRQISLHYQQIILMGQIFRWIAVMYFKEVTRGESWGERKRIFLIEVQCMSAKRQERTKVLDQIIAMELEMFMSVPTAEPSTCQEHPEAFEVMRWMTHSVLSEDILHSYLNDLEEAKRKGRNLMTEKYARMEDKIPKLKESGLIEKIVDIEDEWIRALSNKYPLTFRGGNPGFRKYLSSELETYSDKTLELYHNAATRARDQGRNLAEDRYNKLFERLGYGSIEGREDAARSSS